MRLFTGVLHEHLYRNVYCGIISFVSECIERSVVSTRTLPSYHLRDKPRSKIVAVAVAVVVAAFVVRLTGIL